MKKLLSITLIFITFPFLLAGCSGQSDTDNQNTSENQQTASQNENSDARTINVIGIDKLKFVVAEQKEGLQTGDEVMVNGTTYYLLEGINTEAGEELTINLQTISNLPASAMSHNWLLLTLDADATAFNDASIGAKDNDYIAPDMEDLVITDTGLVGNGESKSITFNAPDETGDYDYLCTFPGHFLSGMKGTLTVE